jgi:hypothetical protein
MSYHLEPQTSIKHGVEHYFVDFYVCSEKIQTILKVQLSDKLQCCKSFSLALFWKKNQLECLTG